MTINNLFEIAFVLQKMVDQTAQNKVPATISYKIFHLTEEVNAALTVPNAVVAKLKETYGFETENFDEAGFIKESNELAFTEIEQKISKLPYSYLEHFYLSVPEINALSPIIEETK